MKTSAKIMAVNQTGNSLTPRDDEVNTLCLYISVVSPVYMAEKILPELCERLTQTLSAITDDYEIILVCDCSPDRSWEVLEQLANQYPKLIVVRLSRNFGQHYATTAGVDIASGEWTVVMDCDLQDQPEEIPGFSEKPKMVLTSLSHGALQDSTSGGSE